MSKKGKALAHMQRQVNVGVSFDNPGSMGFTINTNSENDQDFMFLGEVEVGGAASALGLRNDDILLEIRNQTSCVSVNRCDLESDSMFVGRIGQCLRWHRPLSVSILRFPEDPPTKRLKSSSSATKGGESFDHKAVQDSLKIQSEQERVLEGMIEAQVSSAAKLDAVEVAKVLAATQRQTQEAAILAN